MSKRAVASKLEELSSIFYSHGYEGTCGWPLIFLRILFPSKEGGEATTTWPRPSVCGSKLQWTVVQVDHSIGFSRFSWRLSCKRLLRPETSGIFISASRAERIGWYQRWMNWVQFIPCTYSFPQILILWQSTYKGLETLCFSASLDQSSPSLGEEKRKHFTSSNICVYFRIAGKEIAELHSRQHGHVTSRFLHHKEATPFQ